MLPPAIEDWIGPEHPARFIREFVESIDLAEFGFELPEPTVEGRPRYSPALLLRAWLYGYLKKTRSSRKLEEACAEQMGFIWLCGALRPDHNTLWRFWKANSKALRKLFARSVEVAVNLKMVGFVTQALDGTRIQAQCSSRRTCDEGSLKRMIERLDKELEDYERALLDAQSDPVRPIDMPSELRKSSELREQVRDALAQVEQGVAKHVNPREREARRMSADGRNRFAYNAQAVVDAKSQILVAAEVVDEPNDTQQLAAMVELSERTGGEATQTTLADGGYSTGKQLQKAQARSQEVVMPLPSASKNQEDKPYHASNFAYDEKADEVVCPQGRRIPFQRERIRKGVAHRVYRSAATCKDCPVRSQCTADRHGRAIDVSPWREAIEIHRQKMDTDEAKEAYKRRAPLIEPVFGWIKQCDGMRRWSFKGLESVRTQWAMLCAARNLWKIYYYVKAA